MSLRVALYHHTAYEYQEPVELSPHIIRLRPAPHARTPVLSYSLKIKPDDHFINWQQDIQGNYQARLVFQKPTRTLSVTVDMVVDLEPINPFDFFVDSTAEICPFTYDRATAQELRPYLRRRRVGKRVAALIAEFKEKPAKTVDYLVALNQAIKDRVTYLVRMEPGIQTPDETLKLGRGSCRDSAWLQVAVLRGLGIAARFTSGYLIQLVADEKPVEGPHGPLADFTDLHAWCEAYVPGAGWIGLDATSGMLAGEGHIPVACAADPTNAAPISGGFTPLNPDQEVATEFAFDMRIQRIYESPRPSKPYREGVWERINASGRAVDQRFIDAGIELTMGGEPTFIATDDRDGDEWNTAALGPTKRRHAEDLLQRMAERFATQPLLHHGQGKWYPGEPLPRWALSCFWRSDGQPVWHDQRLLAAGHGPGSHGLADAERLLRSIARHLAVTDQHVMAAYEDPWYLAWQERRFPVDLDPLSVDLSKEPLRANIYRQFARRPQDPVGYVLPLRCSDDAGYHWHSGSWFLRDEHCYLMPGDSPLGFRLPLDSLPRAGVDDPWVNERDPLEPRHPLPPSQAMGLAAFEHGEPNQQQPLPTILALERIQQAQLQQQRDARGTSATDTISDPAALAAHSLVTIDGREVVRTALSVEVRDSRLFVFCPPIGTLEAWLRMVHAIEASAKACELPVVIEGYHPPRDPRLKMFQVTPDPGVIEVNVHPAQSWQELHDIAFGLYDDARHTGLGTEKYHLNGRIGGTGGGNHITLGGPEPARSPFLQRPELLRSLIAFWINHPSLSYLFSGLFIGATSQAPRADEARHEHVSELDLALRELDALGQPLPWQVDRILRHILVDVTGNTHRTEICIDKLFSPDSSSGRLGIVEFRGFEMPPHPQLAMTQALLVRALVACFTERPYREPLARWGTVLHDRFLLPHFVHQDLQHVCNFISDHGIDIDAAWFEPLYEFRFPQIGRIVHDGIEVELRHAMEPWPTLGEEPAGGGTTRFVDSSLDRIEVLVRGLRPGMTVACNRCRLPLVASEHAGEQVCGIRFRTWDPDHCLHPTISAHEPLIIDIIDEHHERAVAGCSYWSEHPGGRNSETRPINANEAAGRRQARFTDRGHTPGPIQLIAWQRHPDYPLTLDLRHVAVQ